MPPAPTGAADIDGARDAPPRGRGGLRRLRGLQQSGLKRQAFGLEGFAQFGADARQIGPCSLRVTTAEHQSHAGLQMFGQRDALAHRVQPDDVAHAHVLLQMTGPVHCRLLRQAQSDQGFAHHGDGLLWLVKGDVQIAQHHLQCRFSVQFQGDQIVHPGDGVRRTHGLAALREAGHASRFAGKGHAAQTTHKAAAGRRAMHRKLRRLAACRSQAAKQKPVGGAFSQLGHELGQFRCLWLGMDECRARLPAARCGHRQRCQARKHAVMFGRQIAQQDGQGGFVPVFRLVGADAHTRGARPVGHAWQSGTHMVKDRLRFAGVVVGDVEQAQSRRARVAGQGHLRAQLGDGQAGGHAPLRVRGMAAGKKFHERAVRALGAAGFLRAGFLAGVLALPAAAVSLAAEDALSFMA